MSKRPDLAKSELEVAQIVWQLGRATVRQVLEALPAQRDLDFKTVQTYLRRLESKGYLKSQNLGRAKVYTARVRPEQVVREVTGSLIQRLFGGATLPLIQHLIEDHGLTQAEFRQLREMLNRSENSPS